MFCNLETSKVNLDPADQMSSRAIPAHQTPTHQLIHADRNLQQSLYYYKKYASTKADLWVFQWNLCGAEEAKEKFVQETEAKAQQMRQVAPKHIQPVLQKN